MFLLPNLWQRKILFLHYSFLSSFNATFYGKEDWNTSSMYVGWHANNIFAPIWLLPISQFPHACLLDSCLFVNTNQFDSIRLRLSGRGASWYVFSLFLANKSRPTVKLFSCVLRGTWFGQKLEKQNLSGVIFLWHFMNIFIRKKGWIIVLSWNPSKNYQTDSKTVKFVFKNGENRFLNAITLYSHISAFVRTWLGFRTKKAWSDTQKWRILSTYLYASLWSGLFIHLSPNLFDQTWQMASW